MGYRQLMEWKQITDCYMQSAEGYRISKAFTECPLPYAAWAPGSKDATPAIGYVDTSKKAMKLCEEHLKLHQGR